jgi:hypothetical protein
VVTVEINVLSIDEKEWHAVSLRALPFSLAFKGSMHILVDTNPFALLCGDTVYLSYASDLFAVPVSSLLLPQAKQSIAPSNVEASRLQLLENEMAELASAAASSARRSRPLHVPVVLPPSNPNNNGIPAHHNPHRLPSNKSSGPPSSAGPPSLLGGGASAATPAVLSPPQGGASASRNNNDGTSLWSSRTSPPPTGPATISLPISQKARAAALASSISSSNSPLTNTPANSPAIVRPSNQIRMIDDPLSSSSIPTPVSSSPVVSSPASSLVSFSSSNNLVGNGMMLSFSNLSPMTATPSPSSPMPLMSSSSAPSTPHAQLATIKSPPPNAATEVPVTSQLNDDDDRSYDRVHVPPPTLSSAPVSGRGNGRAFAPSSRARSPVFQSQQQLFQSDHRSLLEVKSPPQPVPSASATVTPSSSSGSLTPYDEMVPDPSSPHGYHIGDPPDPIIAPSTSSSLSSSIAPSSSSSSNNNVTISVPTTQASSRPSSGRWSYSENETPPLPSSHSNNGMADAPLIRHSSAPSPSPISPAIQPAQSYRSPSAPATAVPYSYAPHSSPSPVPPSHSYVTSPPPLMSLDSNGSWTAGSPSSAAMTSPPAPPLPLPLPRDANQWSVAHCCEWLVQLSPGFQEYTSIFVTKQITGPLLLQLNDSILENELKIPSEWHRRTIAGAVLGLRWATGGSAQTGWSITVVRYRDLCNLRPLGEGNFGVTYTAIWNVPPSPIHGSTQSHTRAVAIKVPKNKSGADEWNELKALIDCPPHRHILPLVGICTDFKGVPNNCCCFVTEFVEGGSLKELLCDPMKATARADRLSLSSTSPLLNVAVQQGDPFPYFAAIDSKLCAARMLQCAADVSAGLAHLHAHGIIHRDIACVSVFP